MRASESYQLQERVLVTECVWEKTSSITIVTFILLQNFHGQFSRCNFSLLGRNFGLCLHTMMYIIIIIILLMAIHQKRGQGLAKTVIGKYVMSFLWWSN